MTKSTIVNSIEEINNITVIVAKAEEKTSEDDTPSPLSRTIQTEGVATMSESVDVEQLIPEITIDSIILAAKDVTTIDIQNDMTVAVPQLTRVEEGEMMRLTSEDHPRPCKSLKR